MRSLSSEQLALLGLLRKSLGSAETTCIAADWMTVEKHAKEQGVLYLLYAGAKAFPELIPEEIVRSWRVAMIKSVMRNEKINQAQKTLVDWLRENDIRAAVLKGTSCSRYYPYPEMRALGDIDLLVDRKELATIGKYLESQGYKPYEHEHSFHVGYHGNGTIVEVHYAGTEVPDSEGGKVVGGIMEHFLEDVQQMSIGDMTFPALSDAHQALMLLLHMERHMTAGGIGLRQLCDWAMFVAGSPSSHWQNGTLQMLESCGLLTYAKVVTKACANYLGIDIWKAQWCSDVSDALAEMMIIEIFRGGNMGVADQGGTRNVFTNRHILGNEKQSRLQGLIANLNQLSYYYWPVTKKCRLLLPFGWVYLCARYVVRSATGSNPNKSVAHLIDSSNWRHDLYKALHLYEIDSDSKR